MNTYDLFDKAGSLVARVQVVGQVSQVNLIRFRGMYYMLSAGRFVETALTEAFTTV